MDLELLLLVAGIAATIGVTRRIGRLEAEVRTLRAEIVVSEPGVANAAVVLPSPPRPRTEAFEPRRSARIVATEPAEASDFIPPPPEPEPERPQEPATPTFESLVGGKLPIWIGGAALVIAGFFLVRYSIESGLIGPNVRVMLAAAFSIILVAASEIARRHALTCDDPRVGQVLAGAGTASAYGTLYVAATQYALIGPVTAFAMTVIVTAIALFLALRHGPPTAVMALIGGFAAPLVAGFDVAGIGALLAYLAVFIAALFALAAQRGWSWLALAAVVAGFGWANLLVVLLEGRDTAGVAAFVVALAIGATLALPRTGTTTGWLRAAPMIAGLVQLLVLAPTLDFGAVAWSFHLVLAAAALVLAWRDRALLPAALAAAVLVTALVAAALLMPETTATPIAAIVAAVMFGGAGLALSRLAPTWASVTLIGFAGPVLAAHACVPSLLAKPMWTMLELVAAAGAAILAWRHRDLTATRDIGLVGGTAIAALLAGIGFTTLAGPAWAPLALVPVLLALGGWAQRIDDADLARLPVLALIAILLLAGEPIAGFIELLGRSLSGDRITYLLLPPLADIARMLIAPALAGAALLALPRAYDGWRRPVMIGLALLAIAIAYALAKQPLAIATADRFVILGFGERAAITALFLASGWGLVKHGRFPRTGQALAAIAVARFLWFDLLVLGPFRIEQRAGDLPIVNLAVLLPAAIALATATIARTRPWRIAALLTTAAAVVAAIRQIAHGTDLRGPVDSGENWGYSAAFLVLAMVWLWRGLSIGVRDLRVAGLALLTLVTLKVFLIDVAALGGLLRILSFMGLGVALIGIGWAYGRIVARPAAS